MLKIGIWRLLLLLLLAAAVLPETWAVQRFEQQPSYTEVNPGQDALLACKIYNKKGSCSWQKDNKPVGMYARKYEWAGSQEEGDCSLRVIEAQLEFDDGLWECQVTASDFTAQDALTSQPVRLVVRVTPQRPRIEFNATHILPGHNLTILHGELATIKCASHYGNPPALLKWFLDDKELQIPRGQQNSTEPDSPRTWRAVSVLELTVSRNDHGKILRCVAVHESYPTRSNTIEVRLDIMFVPETRLVGVPTHDIEELVDSVSVRCASTANPRAQVVWRRSGQTQPAAMQEVLQLSPAVRQHAGLYTCHARNRAGESSPLSVHIDIKYPPKILSVGPDRLTTAVLFSSAALECVAEGNPAPSYQWLQREATPGGAVVERGREPRLVLPNVTYELQGEFVCKVSNVISGTRRTVQSEAVAIQVVGAPQVLKQLSSVEVHAEAGDDVGLSLVVCADPRPNLAAWEWGSLRLEAGAEMGRFRAEELVQDVREDCYEARLRVLGATAADSRAYYLLVHNDRGADRHAVFLRVHEPLQLSALLGLAGAGLVILVLLVCVCVYAARTEKCCFARKGDFKPSDGDSEKLDLEKNATTNSSIGGPGGIPADAIYTTTPGSRFGRLAGPGGGGLPVANAMATASPEVMKAQKALKRRRDHEWDDDGADDDDDGDVNIYEAARNETDTEVERAFGRKQASASASAAASSARGSRPRPRPLQANEAYYNHVFPPLYKPRPAHRAEI